MRKPFLVLVTLIVALAIGFGSTTMFADNLMAKPIICKLLIDPIYVCKPSPSCKNPGEQVCWRCLGIDIAGEPCLCAKVGCMVPPQ